VWLVRLGETYANFALLSSCECRAGLGKYDLGVEIEVKLFLCLIKHHSASLMGVEVKHHAFLIMAIDGSELYASHSGRFSSGIRTLTSAGY
jgi:hypothetical protein